MDRRGPDECWPWTRLRDVHGYGIFCRDGKNGGAHRAAWEAAFGPIPAGLWVLHRCDNPPCVNPAHLFLGTAADNNGDRDRKGRGALPGLRGEDLPQARLTEADVREIRRSYAGGGITQRALSIRFGIGPDEVSRVIGRKRWAHVP